MHLLAAPTTGLGRGLGPDAPLASLTLGGLLGLSGLLYGGLCSSGCSRLLGGAVWRRRLDLGWGGSSYHLLLDDLLLEHLGCCCPSGNHLHLSGSWSGCLGLRLGLDLNRTNTSMLFLASYPLHSNTLWYLEHHEKLDPVINILDIKHDSDIWTIKWWCEAYKKEKMSNAPSVTCWGEDTICWMLATVCCGCTICGILATWFKKTSCQHTTHIFNWTGVLSE